MARLNLCPTLIVLLLSHLSLSTAQLMGRLTRCNHDPDLITAVITNTHTRHISVLKHNTIFDTSHLSVPFKVTNAAGTGLPMGMSHLFYSGVGRDDFLDLAPGRNFTRELNLTEYVALEPEESKRLQTIEISLPSTFRGLKDHDGVYDVHPAAEGRLIDGQLQFGDVSKANLTSISHTSVPFQITLSVPARRSRVEARQAPVPGGLQLLVHECTPRDAAKADTGMLHASYLAGAALNAASNFGNVPFNYFFPGNLRAASIVAGVMNRVIQSHLGQGAPIHVTCNDFANRCKVNRALIIPGYVAQYPDFIPAIVLCSTGLSLPLNPTPCSARPGTVSIGNLLLHELSHVQSISGPGLDVQDEVGGLAQNVGDAVKAGRDTTTDASAYGFLGSWAWDLGLGGQPWNQQKVCLERFSTGQFTANPFFR